MTLPTTQPVDWPDWGVLPTFDFQSLGNATVNAPGELICQVNTGYFSHALIVAIGDGDGSSWDATIQWYTAAPLEGGALVSEQVFTHRWLMNNVIPVTSLSGWLRIVDNGSDLYPHSANINITLFTQRGYMTGWPGGIFAVNYSPILTDTESVEIIPNGCGPGLHSLSVVTSSTAWQLYLRTFLSYVDYRDTLLADETHPTPYNIEWLAGPSSWSLGLFNTDPGPQDFTVLAIRQP